MRKIISICLAFCIMLSLLCNGGAFAASTAGDTAEMKAVLTQVKTKITVPEKYSEFEYRYISRNEDSYWIFTWEWMNNGNIQIQADSKGRITSYGSWMYTNGKESRAPNLTRAEAQAKAAEFAKKAIPEVYAAMGKQPEHWVNSSGQYYNFTYARYENGVPCVDQQVSIRVNYITGDIENMNVNWLYDVEFKKVDAPIGEEQAKLAWKDRTELELKYLYDYSGIDSVGKKIRAYLAYVPSEETKSVDAETGEILEQEYEWVYDKDAGDSVTEDTATEGASGGSSNSANRVELSEKELEKLSEHDNLLTLNQADQKIRAFTQLSLTSNFRISSSNLVADSYAYPVAYGEEEGIGYSWRIVYTGPVAKEQSPQTIYVNIDAVTGELESYRDYETNELNIDKTAKITQSQAQATADGFIKKVSEDKAENVLPAEAAEAFLWNAGGKRVQAGWNFQYRREHENIPVANDGVNISVNRMTGKITSYTRTWQKLVEFETTAGIIDEKTAIAAYIDNAKANLEYHIFTTYLYDVEGEESAEEKPSVDYVGISYEARNKKSTILVYSFESPSTNISAKSGKYINAYGAEVTETDEEKAFSGYTDTKGHYAEREISLLADIGVLPQRDKFMPYQAVKQKEFLYYLFMGANSYRMYTGGSEDTAVIDEVYATALSSGVITEKEINCEASINRYQAIRFLVRYMGLGKLASDPAIFRVNFIDAGSIPGEYMGSVAIGKSMQIIGGSNGRFNGAQNLSNGDAAKMIYNTLKKAGEY